MKRIHKKLNMQNISDLNNIYNFQDTINLCEIFESLTQMMMEKHKFNPRKYSLTSTLSDCMHRNMRKVIISLPINTKNVEAFKKTLIGGFSCINTRLAFDSNILLPKNKDGVRKTNLKVLCKIRMKKKCLHR